MNYISIEKLQEKNEKEMESLLNSYDIDYKNWPDYIKEDFKLKIRNTKNTRILDPQKEEEIKKVHYELKNLMNQLYNFKTKIKYHPEMVTYEENTDKLINKLKEIGSKFIEKLSIEKTGTIATSFGGVSLIIPIFTGDESVESNFSKDAPKNDNFDGKSDHNNHCNENHEKNKFNSSEKNNNNNSNNNNNNDNNKNNNDLKEKAINILDSDLFFSVYLTLSFSHLGWSLLEFSQAYTDLNNSKNDIKSYKKRFDDIKEQFDEHKEKLGILPDDFKESLEKIKEVFNLICQDYSQLEILIKEIYETITIANDHKNKSTLGLIGSGIFVLLE